MNTKAFVSLLVAVLVLGGGIGGAFVGGIALGKSQVAEAAPVVAPTAALTPGSVQQSFGGALTSEQRDQFRQQFQGQFGGADGGRTFSGRGFSRGGGLTGAIEKIEGNTLTINTAQGPLLATVTAETTIQQVVEVTIADLLAGMQVTVIGAPGEGGAMVASTILVVSEGQDSILGGLGFFGGPGSSGDGQDHDQQPP